MWKQFLTKLPKKSSASGKGDHGSGSSPGRNATGNGGAIQRTSSCPGAGPARPVSSVKRMSSAVFPSSVVAGIEPLVSFKDVPNGEKQNLFVSKVSLCCVVFDFSDPNKNSAEKDFKRQALVDLMDYVDSASSRFTETMVAACCRMFTINLFRVFPPNYRSGSSGSGEGEEEEPMFDPAWTHLHLVYDLLLKFIGSSSLDTKIGKKYFDHTFIVKLLELFDSEDPRERDCLKTILHRIYGKFMVHRPFIRKAVTNIFYHFVFETDRHNGIAELLEVFGSVISGFALPLKEEHKIFLWRVLIPLHKPKSVGLYLQQLTYCVTQFVEKEPKLASSVILGLLRYWPITNSQKEVMFLSEIEEVLEATNMVEFQKFMVPLFRRIAQCINSSNFQRSRKRDHTHIKLGKGLDGIEFQKVIIQVNLSSIQLRKVLHIDANKEWPQFMEPCLYPPLSLLLDLNSKGDGSLQKLSKVAERALFMWNNDHIVSLVAQNRQAIMPIVTPALEENIQNHWNVSVLNLTTNVKKMLSEMDEELFSACLATHKEEEEMRALLEGKRRLAWELLESAAAFQPVTGNTAVLVSR